jgi:hypothetical protein
VVGQVREQTQKCALEWMTKCECADVKEDDQLKRRRRINSQRRDDRLVVETGYK